MRIALDLIRRFSARLMLVAVLALALQAGVASASGLGGVVDCPDDSLASQAVDRGDEAVSVEYGNVDHVDHGAPCRSACCSVACSMAVLGVSAAIPLPALVRVSHGLSVVYGTEGIDPVGLSRPPKARLAV